jgi:hypothetical protein
MKLLYQKDECAPDAQSVYQWADENKIDWLHEIKISIGFDDTIHKFFAAKGHYYLMIFSCGVYEEIFECETREEWECEIKNATELFLANS